MIRAWRICKAKHAPIAFTGEGAKLTGGRWNSPGRHVIYTADSTAAAVLELAVHTDAAGLKLKFVLILVEFDESLVEHLDSTALPSMWRRSNHPAPIAAGDEWLRSARTTVLAVPSAIVPSATNYLLNPRHPGFASMTIHSTIPHVIDPRIKA